jgi:P-type conjugative transfer protein VirB9
MRLAIALAMMLACAPAAALDTPSGTSADARVKYVNYNESDVVAVYAYQGVATHIMFAPGEEVLDIASGFSAGWEFKNRRNNLYLKPKSLEPGDVDTIAPVPGRWDTNLVVTTDRRVYSFQLFLIGPRSPGAKLAYDPRMAFRITFRYPADERAAELARQEEQFAARRIANPPTPRNTHYTMQVGKRSEAIAPTTAFDDGRFTYLRFPNNREIPAVFLVARDKSESLVNTHVENDMVVIQRVAPELVLRLGKQVVSVFNEAYDIDGVAPAQGTTVDGVRREIMEGVQQ